MIIFEVWIASIRNACRRINAWVNQKLLSLKFCNDYEMVHIELRIKPKRNVTMSVFQKLLTFVSYIPKALP